MTLSPGAGALGQIPGDNFWYSGATSGAWRIASNWGTGPSNFVVPGSTFGTTNTSTATFNNTSITTAIVPDPNRNLETILFDTNATAFTIGAANGNALLMSAGGDIKIASTFSGSNITETVNAPLTLEGSYTLESSAASGTATLRIGGPITSGVPSGTTTLTLTGSNSGANTVAGSLADNGAGRLSVVKDGAGLWILSGANSYSGGTTVLAGTLRFDITSGTPTFGAGATATVNAGATLELAGSVSALSSGANRANVGNNSASAGLLVTGTNQQVGNIDGSGTTQVNSGSDLTANHIIQGALVIGGTSTSPGFVTIDASGASGNPLADALPLQVSVDGAPAGVPEPSTLLMLAAGALAMGLTASRRCLRLRFGRIAVCRSD